MIHTQKRLDKGMWWDRAWSLVEGCTHVSAGRTLDGVIHNGLPEVLL